MAGTSLTDSAFLFWGEGEGLEAICFAQTKRVWQMQLLELKCLEAKRLPFAEPAKTNGPGAACKRAIWFGSNKWSFWFPGGADN